MKSLLEDLIGIIVGLIFIVGGILWFMFVSEVAYNYGMDHRMHAVAFTGSLLVPVGMIYFGSYFIYLLIKEMLSKIR